MTSKLKMVCLLVFGLTLAAIFPAPMEKGLVFGVEAAQSTPISATNIARPSAPNDQETLGIWNAISLPLQSTYYVAGFSSAEDGWAFGSNNPAHWNGHEWSEEISPKELQGRVTDAKFLSSDNGWAVGFNGRVFHWDGYQWTKVSAPTHDNDVLYGVDFASSQLGWAVGVAGIDKPSTIRSFMLEWNGAEWIRLDRLPTKHSLFAIDVLSKTAAWAVGSPMQWLHWNGKLWLLYENTATEGLEFNSISGVTPDSVWMVGDIPGTSEGIIWHWDGSQWAEFQRTRAALFCVSMVSSDFGWAVGGNENGSLLLHWNGYDWKEYPISTTAPLQFVWAPNTADGWIFGGGPSFHLQSEYPGIAFRYRMPTVTSTPVATVSNTPIPTSTNTETPSATQAPVLSPTPVPSSSPPMATSTTTPLRPASGPAQNLRLWVGLAMLLVLAGGGAMILVYRRRRG